MAPSAVTDHEADDGMMGGFAAPPRATAPAYAHGVGAMLDVTAGRGMEAPRVRPPPGAFPTPSFLSEGLTGSDGVGSASVLASLGKRVTAAAAPAMVASRGSPKRRFTGVREEDGDVVSAPAMVAVTAGRAGGPAVDTPPTATFSGDDDDRLTSLGVVASRHPIQHFPPRRGDNQDPSWVVSAPPSSMFQNPFGAEAMTREAPATAGIGDEAPMRGASMIVKALGQQAGSPVFRIHKVFRFAPYVPNPSRFGSGTVETGVAHGHLGFAVSQMMSGKTCEVIGLPELNYMLLKDGLLAAAGSGRDFKSAKEILDKFRSIGFCMVGTATGTDTKRGMTNTYSMDAVGAFLEGENTFTYARGGYNTQAVDIWGSAGHPATELGVSLVAFTASAPYCAAAGMSAGGVLAKVFQFVPSVGRSVAGIMEGAAVADAGPYRVCSSQVLGFQDTRHREERPEDLLPRICNPKFTSGFGCVSLNAKVDAQRPLRDFSFE